MLTLIHQLTPAQIEQLHQMYLKEWWSQERALADVPILLNNTDLLFGLWDDEAQQLAAFARVLTDWVYHYHSPPAGSGGMHSAILHP